MSHRNTVKRRELKFVLSKDGYDRIISRLDGRIVSDEYPNETIGSIYFDNGSDELIRNSLAKPVYKEKLRLRCYGVPSDDAPAFAEIKKKYRGTVYKRREQLPYAQAYDWLVGGKPPAVRTQITDEIDFIIKKYGLYPRIIICYDRQSFYAEDDEELRITFDGNIRSRRTALDLRAGTFGEMLNGQPYRIMEIKTADSVPMWLTEILSEEKIYIGSFSKYGSIYRQENLKVNTKEKNNVNGENEECFQAL